MATHSFRLLRPLSSARRDSIVLIRCSSSTCNTQINFMVKTTDYVATNVIEVASQAGQRRWPGPIAHGRRIWLIDTSQAIAATVEANGALSCTFCLFAPGGFPPSDKELVACHGRRMLLQNAPAIGTCLPYAPNASGMQRADAHVHNGTDPSPAVERMSIKE